MDGKSKSFRATCAWCGDPFNANRASDKTCCLGCSEELYQLRLDVQHTKAEFRAAKEDKEIPHERITRLKNQMEPKIQALKRLGLRWRKAKSDEERLKLEARESRVARTLIPLQHKEHRINRKALLAERRLSSIEERLVEMKRIIEDDSPLDGF
jgi:hypothetical protein